jgi:hypothetical protein
MLDFWIEEGRVVLCGFIGCEQIFSLSFTGNPYHKTFDPSKGTVHI